MDMVGAAMDRQSGPEEHDVSIPVMDEMIAEMEAGPAVYRPSNIWHVLLSQHIKLLETYGIERFKRTVNMNYAFDAPFIEGSRLLENISAILGRNHPERQFEIKSPEEYFAAIVEGVIEGREALIYGGYVAMLWDLCLQFDSFDLCRRVSEPAFGDPIFVNYRGTRITQDLAKSVIDLIAILARVPSLTSGVSYIAEIGPGFGRLAHAFAQTSDCRYAFFDIPPTLFVAQSYFEHLYPGQVAPFRRYRSHDEIVEVTADKRFHFFTANQLSLFPAQSFDAMINIDSFGEMAPETVRTFMGHMSEATRVGGLLYLRNLIDSSISHLNDKKWEGGAAANHTPDGEWQRISVQRWQLDPNYGEQVFIRRG
jgi:putative sugar O-methyltransferase